AEQARACRAEPSVRMNPILLKPTTDIGAQVIVLGKPVGTLSAREYEALKPTLRPTIIEALQALMADADIVVIEGAGSPAEINLKAEDLVNMWVAEQAEAHVLLVGDIDRGGVFAQLVGTMELLSDTERARVHGFLINKFRGDLSLLEPGNRWLETRYGLPVVGTIPYFHDVELAEEDTVPSHRLGARATNGRLRIEVLHLPRMSNFTDFDPLAREPDVALSFIDRPSDSPPPDCVILPGTKSTIADLAFVRERGLDGYVSRCAQAGAEVIGICGGFQMLSREIQDPEHVEAAVGNAPGLRLLPGTTVFRRQKTVAQVRGIHLESGLPVEGYEIHMGEMRPAPGVSAVFRFTERAGLCADCDDGLRTPDGSIWGTHLHSLFDAAGFRRWWLNRLRHRRGWPSATPHSPLRTRHSEDVYDRLAETVRPHLNMPALYQMLGGS
ncbi:MAG: cobyric acid synthase, partial [Candidatus Omnitrophica bacterium]|nr:cobyric acid synthase [Candidatus Omnitrophota bacterium]